MPLFGAANILRVLTMKRLRPDSVNWMEGKRFEAGTTKEAMRTWLENVIVK